MLICLSNFVIIILQKLTKVVIIVAVTIATVSCAAALAFTLWSATGGNLVIAAIFVVI